MRVLVLTHQEFDPPERIEALPYDEIAPWKTEYDVWAALRQLGHETRVVGAATELADIRGVLEDWRPRIVFNLLEEFRGKELYIPFVLGYLQLLRVPYTGCNPASLLMVDNKPMTKKVLRWHRIPVPDFAVFPRGRRIVRPSRLAYPLIVKSTTIHGSAGIAQKSVVTNDAQLEERVRHVHERLGTEAIAERYVEGRELYVGMLGNRRLETLPLWELRFDNLPEGVPAIATERVKWDVDYQERRGIRSVAADDVDDRLRARIDRLCRRVYRILGLDGYARMDLRLDENGRTWLLEANPNPDLACDEDYAESAIAGGIPYERLVQRILNLGLRRHAEGR